MLLHLLHAHIVIIRLDSLFGVRRELWLPLRFTLLSLLYGIVLVVVDFGIAVRSVFVSIWN